MDAMVAVEGRSKHHVNACEPTSDACLFAASVVSFIVVVACVLSSNLWLRWLVVGIVVVDRKAQLAGPTATIFRDVTADFCTPTPVIPGHESMRTTVVFGGRSIIQREVQRDMLNNAFVFMNNLNECNVHVETVTVVASGVVLVCFQQCTTTATISAQCFSRRNRLLF